MHRRSLILQIPCKPAISAATISYQHTNSQIHVNLDADITVLAHLLAQASQLARPRRAETRHIVPRGTSGVTIHHFAHFFPKWSPVHIRMLRKQRYIHILHVLDVCNVLVASSLRYGVFFLQSTCSWLSQCPSWSITELMTISVLICTLMIRVPSRGCQRTSEQQRYAAPAVTSSRCGLFITAE